jgi:hypothetical protein
MSKDSLALNLVGEYIPEFSCLVTLLYSSSNRIGYHAFFHTGNHIHPPGDRMF